MASEKKLLSALFLVSVSVSVAAMCDLIVAGASVFPARLHITQPAHYLQISHVGQRKLTLGHTLLATIGVEPIFCHHVTWLACNGEDINASESTAAFITQCVQPTYRKTELGGGKSISFLVTSCK